MDNLQIADIIPTKATALQMAEQIKEIVESGTVDPMQIAIKLNCLELAIKEAKELIKPSVMDAINVYSEKQISILGAKVEKAEVGTKYDYSNDPKWNELNKVAETANLALKTHEDMLKKISSGKVLVGEDSGETYFAPIKSSTSSYKITLGN
jgi:hypothetical protein